MPIHQGLLEGPQMAFPWWPIGHFGTEIPLYTPDKALPEVGDGVLVRVIVGYGYPY